MKLQIFIYLLFNLFYVTYSKITISSCSDDIPNAVSFISEGCDTTPCPLKKGTDANANITLRIPYDMDQSTFKVQAKTFGFWVPFNPPDNNACHSLTNSYCPFEQGELVTYNLRLPIAKIYPTISLTLKLTFFDDKQQPIMCFQVDCQVVD